MITIQDYKLRLNSEGDSFFVLILSGGVEIIRSANGNTYATAKKASLPTTFDERVCKALLGTQLPGKIEKVVVEPYQYTIEDTGEVITLSHRYEYQDEEAGNESLRTGDFQHVLQPFNG